MSIVSYLSYFDTSTVNFAWREPRRLEIERRRALLNDLLIFDILLSSAGINHPDVLYPPGDEKTLHRLLEAIETCQYDTLKKNCLIYFLLKWYQDGREEKFQNDVGIPPQFVALSNAYWILDSGINVPRAISLLSDARLNRDYASKILQAISLSPDSAPLIRKYVRTAKPPLTQPDDLDIYTLALAESSLLESFQFQRTFSEGCSTRSRLFKKLLEWCVIPAPRPIPLKHLVSFPLSAFEQDIVISCASGRDSFLPPFAISVMQDLVCVRLLLSGKCMDAIKMDRQFKADASHPRANYCEERTSMVQRMYAALPAAERQLIDDELEEAKLTKKTNSTKDILMSQPSRDIPGSTQFSNDEQLSGNLAGIPISDRPGAPHFGGLAVPLNDSPISQIPFIPVRNTAAHSGMLRKGHALRQSLPLNTHTNISLLRTHNSRQSLSGVGSRMGKDSMLSFSSPTSGIKVPAPSSAFSLTSKTKHGFASAGRQSNAFYRPPIAQLNTEKRSLEEHPEEPRQINDDSLTNPDAEPEFDGGANENDGKPNAQIIYREDTGSELGFSVFDRPPSPDASGIRTPRRSTRTGAISVRKKRDPPGAFLTDDEDDAMNEDQDNIRRPAGSTRASTIVHEQPDVSSRRTRTGPQRTTRTHKSARQSVPGGLMEDEENEAPEEQEREDMEERDRVAPLPATSPVKHTVRKVRSPTLSDPGDEYEGIQPRRRSSRLSTTSSIAVEGKRKKIDKAIRKKR